MADDNDKKKPSGIDAVFAWVAHQIDEFISPKHKEATKLSSWVSYLAGKGVSRGLSMSIAFIAIHLAAFELLPQYVRLVWGWIFLALPIILTIGFARAFWAFWKWYVTTHFIFVKTNPVLLEIRMPTEVTKSPRAMEQVLSTLWISSGESNEIARNWDGGVRPYFSLEIASFGGQIRFFIWTRASAKNVVEAAFYAQYPEVEIVEVPDYALTFQFDPAQHFTFWSEYKLSSKDVFPIKTYVDFELDKDPKEEFKVEPLAQMLEMLGLMKQGEQAWLQICFRRLGGDDGKKWVADIQKAVDEIRKKMSLGDASDPAKGFPRPTWSQQEQMRNMERNMGKLAFYVGIRSVYIAPQGKARSVEFSAIRMIFRPFFNSAYQNEIQPTRGDNSFDYPWQDYKDIRKNITAYRFLDAYRRRQFWHPPWQLPSMRMSSEVIATIWHPPSRTVATPGLQRIPTSKAEPPPNLPL